MATDETEQLLKQLRAQFAAQGQELDNENLSSLVRQLQDRDQHDWCEAAGQSEPLTTRLKNLLKDYPADVGLFKEMVQNADDAGATRVHFIWDTRTLGRASLLSPEMAAWQNKTLWAFNDALFTEQDFEAICRLGVGGKRSTSERIGRFGLGFNSVYNLTDLPSILSDSMVLFLDPHVSHLRKMGASTQKPGIKLRFLKVNVLERFPDQFRPYHGLLGCDLESSSPFKGTLIRIPFRNKESAARSEISNIVVSDDMVAALSEQFRAEAFQWLLFLQNVQEISMSRLSDTSPLEMMFSVSLSVSLQKRPSLVTQSGRGTISTQLEVLCENIERDKAKDKKTKRKYHLFTDPQHGFRSRVCLAVPLRDGDWCHDEDGRVFCFLPLPRNVDLGLRLHVHAPLNMAQDRRSVLLDNRIGESEQELVRHNFRLLDDLIPSALLACLQDLAVKRNQMPPSNFFAFFPSLNGSAAPSERIATTFYSRLLRGEAPCPLPVPAPARAPGSMQKQNRMEAAPAYWVKVSEAIFVPSALENEVSKALLDSVVDCLLRCGVSLVDAPAKILESIMRLNGKGQGRQGDGQGDGTESKGRKDGKDGRSSSVTVLTPAWLRHHLRAAGGLKSHALSKTAGDGIFSQLTPADVANLLEFAVSDGDVFDLYGVPLLMCEDESTVHCFSASGQSVFFPRNSLERRLFPSKDGRKLVLATKFEERPVLWAKFKRMAEQAVEETQEIKFQVNLLSFQKLLKALQMLLPRTWNNPVPRISMSEYSEWVEDWLQAIWKWLEDRDVEMFQMVHWPLIPSLSDGTVDLIRIPEPHKLILFSQPKAPKARGYPPPPPDPTVGTVTQVANDEKPSEKAEASPLRIAQVLLETRLHCRPVSEPSWLSQHHEKRLRTCVHACSVEGLLKTTHFAAKIICSCQRETISAAQAVHRSLSKLSPQDVRSLLFIATTAQKEGCICEGAKGSWKGRCEVLRGLPFLCRFNQPLHHISLSDGISILPETCPEVLAALRAAQVDLPTCAEIPDDVLSSMTSSERLTVTSLLRELELPRLTWSELLLKHIFVWAADKSKDATVRQGLMRAVVYHWRDMDLTGHGACIDALQDIPFISTVGGSRGSLLSAAEALDPGVEKLHLLYGPGDVKGPFPEARWLSSECRAVLQFRSALNYQELSERLGFLHQLEVDRREMKENEKNEMREGKSGESQLVRESRVPVDVLAVAHALLRYICDTVTPAMTPLEEKQETEEKPEGIWQMLGFGEKERKEKIEKNSGSALSQDELLSIQSKLRRCFWLPPLNAPNGWPGEAPWKASSCGLCSAEEVRLVSEEFLVGMVRPLIGLVTPRTGVPGRPPRRFLDSLGLSEKPDEALLRDQLKTMEEWANSLESREVHASWITRCLYDHLYPALLHAAVVEEFFKENKRIWVRQGGFVPTTRIARQSIEFPPYLVRAPVEWKEKVPHLWPKIKDSFRVEDLSEALGCIEQKGLDAQSLDIAVRLVMAITDTLQERAEKSGAAAAAGSKLDILMPTSESALRPARDCVFNNMTWLPDVETADLNLGSFCLVHPKISHAVAHTCGCRGLSLVYAREATEMHGADWCEAAGQSEPITTRLKNLLKDYPADISMFKEMVQNADDAGATEVHFVWDWRQHRKQSLLTPDMDRWQGPALWIFNNAQFTSKDFDSICRLGVGGKREQLRKIGRFGLGFNSVYNFTDLPSILSGDMVLFLDPHVHHLSAMGASVQKPGIKLRFLKINVLEKFRDQFEPYHGMLGCDLSSSHPFEGTLIRVPFRTSEAAKASEVSSVQLDNAAVEMLSSRFQQEAFQWLLFLQSVAQIRLSEIREGHGMRCLSQVSLLQAVPSVPRQEPKDTEEEAAEAQKRSPKRTSVLGSDCAADIADVTIKGENFGSAETYSAYRLVSGANCGVSEQVCAAMPLADVPGNPGGQVALRKEEGRLFCFLPLPSSAVSLRLSFHVHAPLNTTQDRRNVLLDHRVGDNEIINKNVRMLDLRIPECIAKCAVNLSSSATPQELFSIFPILHRSVRGEAAGEDALCGVADRVAHSFYKLMIRKTEPIFPTIAKKCVPFSQAVLCSEREAKISSGATEEGAALLDKVTSCLARFGVPVVKLPLPVLESFEQVLHPVLPRVLTPAWLRQFLRNITATSKGFQLKEETEGQDVSNPHLTIEEAVAFLDFAMADNDVGDLQGVPLLFTEDVTAGTQPFATGTMLFVPEEEQDYKLLPQAPRRLLSKQIRALRPWVWHNLQRMASAEAKPTGDECSFQLRKTTVQPLMSALQELLPKTWNVPVPEVTELDWKSWVEDWLRSLWSWLSRMSVPTRNMLHWPIVPSFQETTSGTEDQAARAVVRLHRLLPDSTLFLASKKPESSNGLMDGAFGKVLADLMQTIKCTPVRIPDWLQERAESQLNGFVHPDTADGLMKACHNRLRAFLKSAEKEGQHHHHARIAFRKLFPKLSAEQQNALGAWLLMTGPESCECHKAVKAREGTEQKEPKEAKEGRQWRLRCDIIRSTPLFSPFGSEEQVALVDFKGESEWRLLPEACPEVVAALRAAAVPMKGCLEPAAAENVQALVRELHMPRLAWAEVLLEYVFPWASQASEPGARQGLMLAVVQRWREMELAGREQCVEALQLVPFIPSVTGEMRSPATLLDPRNEGLKLIYAADGPFPAQELVAVLIPLLQRGLLRFRQELSLEELHQRLTFLDSKSDFTAAADPAEWDKVCRCAESLLQYVATNVTLKCEEVAAPREEAAPKPEKAVAVDRAAGAAAAAGVAAAARNFWSTIMPLGDFLTAAVPEKEESLAKREEWSEDDVENLKCKVRSCRWIPAARAPREWLLAVPWAGKARKLWRPSELKKISEFWLCGAASPVLDLETQVAYSPEQKQSLSKTLELLGIFEMPATQKIDCAWSQLQSIHDWLQRLQTQGPQGPQGASDESEESHESAQSAPQSAQSAESAWISKCLYHYVYPVCETDDDRLGELKSIFVAGSFVKMEDLSISQDFNLAGLHQIPKELQSTSPKLCQQLQSAFRAPDLARALQRLSERSSLSAPEMETAVRLAIALSERIRGQAEAAEHIMVPTSQGKLQRAEHCVFNNMRWLSEDEQQKRNRAVTASGLHWVHQSISNDVAASLKVQALSTQVAAEALALADDEKDPEWFEAAGQTEPLTTRLRSLLRDSSEDLGLFKSLLQNADDAKATEVHFVWDWRSFGRQSLMSPEMARWQGPCLWVHNNSSFTPQDFENITQLGAVKSTSRKEQIGRFGLGFNSVYTLTDLPSILSDDVVLFLDPHVHHLKAMGASPAKPGIKLRFLRIDVLDKFRDQFEPYHGMFGCDLASSAPYEGTLIRLPFRTPEAAKASEINKAVVSPKDQMALLTAFRDAAAECLVFLQHVRRIQFSWIPQDASPGATPTSMMDISIAPPGVQCTPDKSSQKVSTAEQALEYRRLFSSRSVAKSKEKQSFIFDVLSRFGVAKEEARPRPYIAFNLVVSISWSPPLELQQKFDTAPVQRMEAWRLMLQHDNPEDERWKADTQAAQATSLSSLSSFDFVPFGGLALCLSRPLRPEEPRISCFLPLPIKSSLPFLINANFSLSDPTAPQRLDLARGTAGAAATSEWNALLLRNIIEPLICTLIRDQAGAIQARSEVASWAESICSLMPRNSQLPPSLQELLNLPSIYKELSGSALFPPLSRQTGAQQITQLLEGRLRGSLLSYVDSVQPLADDVEERVAVHEYLSQVNGYHFCDVTADVAVEFSGAGVKRKAKVDRSLVLSCILGDAQQRYSSSMASKLLSFILREDGGTSQDSDIIPKLQGLKLAPLCDGKVAPFGNDSDSVLFCAFGADPRSSLAQRVLQQLIPKATMDLSSLDSASIDKISCHATDLGLRNVQKCSDLCNALLSLPSIRASEIERTLLATLDETFGGRFRSTSRQATAESIGFGSDASANSTLCALWSFIELAEGGLTDEFLAQFNRFYLVPAWDPKPGDSSALSLIPLSASEPLLLPESDDTELMDIATLLLPDRFVDRSHPAMTDSVIHFLKQNNIVHAFSRGSLLAVLAAWSSAAEHLSSLIARCQRLQPQQRHLLRSQLCQALCDPIASDDQSMQARASLVAKLPIFLAESEGDTSQAFRSLMQMAVVDGEPLTLQSTPVRLDLDTVFVFRGSPKTSAEDAEALGLPEVRSILAEKYFDTKTWLQKQVLPHLNLMIPEDQVRVLERLLPLLQDIEEANSEPYLVPVEARGKIMKPPLLVLDPQDFTIQEIFDIRGEDWPALEVRHRYHFPAKTLSATVISHLRRLGMRNSVGDGHCLAFLCQVLRDKHGEVTRQRYSELQRGLMQRIVESWGMMPDGPHKDVILQQAFVDASPEADSSETFDTLFNLKAFAPEGHKLFKLPELVSRSNPLDPYLCWTTLPLCPRGFPDFEGYHRPALKDVVAHIQALGSFSDGTIPLHHWEEFKEKVVGPMCDFLAQQNVSQEVQVCSRLRKAKFIAVPLDAGSTGPHALVAPWRISLVLKEHRPPMFALPEYLNQHVPVLRALGVRDAVELPQDESMGDDNTRADEAMTWLFENGAESFSDVTVRCDGGSLYLHRNILMSRSEYFKAMFQGGGGGFRESQGNSVEVVLEFPLEVATVLFGYLYHGKVDERPLEGPEATSNSVDLMCMADQLGVPRLFEFAQLWVANQQDLEDCSEMLKLASRHCAELLERATLSLMAANYDSLEVEQQLPSLPEEQRLKLEEMVKRPKTN